jgi:hypothetical protein
METNRGFPEMCSVWAVFLLKTVINCVCDKCDLISWFKEQMSGFEETRKKSTMMR